LAIGFEEKNKKSPYCSAPTVGRKTAFQEGLSSRLERKLLKTLVAVGGQH